MGKRLTQQEQDWRMTPEKGPGGVQATVKNAALTFGWLYCHFNDSRRQVMKGGHVIHIGDDDAKGWPDTFLLRGPEVVIVECKKELGQLEDEQRLWLLGLHEANLECWVARPSNLQHLVNRLGRRYAPQRAEVDVPFTTEQRGLCGPRGLGVPSDSPAPPGPN